MGLAAMQSELDRITISPRTDDPVLLLVNEDPSALKALWKCFRREGYELISAGSGVEALHWVSESSVDLVISEERMPDMAGLELLEEIHRRSPLTSCVLLTFQLRPTVLREGFRAGASAILSEPWNEEALRKTVRRLLRRPSDGR